MKTGAGVRNQLFLVIVIGGTIVSAFGADPVLVRLGPPPEEYFPEVRVLLEQLASTYNAGQPDTVVSVAPDDPAFLTRDITRDDLGDVVFLSASSFGEASPLAAYASRGFLEPLTSLIEGQEFNRDDFYPGLWDAATFDGNVYGVPLTVRSWALGVNGGYCEPSIVDPHLADWDALLEFMATTQIDLDNDGVMDALMAQTGREAKFLWETLFLEYGGDPEDPNSFNPSSEAWIRATARVTGLMDRAPSLFTPRELSHRRFESFWQPIQFVHNDGMDPGALPMLQRRNPGWMAVALPGDARLPALDTTVVAVRSGSPERVEASWRFVAWLTSPDVMALLYPSADLVPLRRSVAAMALEENTRVFLRSLERITFQRPRLLADPGMESLRAVLEE